MVKLTINNLEEYLFLLPSSMISYRYNNSIMKLQRMGKGWGFVNLSNPTGQYNNSIDQLKDEDFSTPESTIKVILSKSPTIEIFYFNTIESFFEWCLKK